MAAMTNQPQGYAGLNPAFRLAQAPGAIMVGGMRKNVVTGKNLTGNFDQTNPMLLTRPPGLVYQFWQGSWLVADMPSAPIGNRSFIEFWHGYPTASFGISGGGPEPTFVLGSTTNNAALLSRMANNHHDNTDLWESWGCLYVWGGQSGYEMIGAGDILTPNVLTTIMAVHKQDRVEMWRDGILRRVVMIPTANRGQADMVAGAFLRDSYWTSYSEMAMCGRLIVDNVTAGEAAALSGNPWIMFDDGVELEEDPIARQLRNALYLNGTGYFMPRPAGNPAKPLVLMPNGEIKQRAGAEGKPIILDGDGLRTLKDTEDLIE